MFILLQDSFIKTNGEPFLKLLRIHPAKSIQIIPRNECISSLDPQRYFRDDPLVDVRLKGTIDLLAAHDVQIAT